jgi:hypothetical protein
MENRKNNDVGPAQAARQRGKRKVAAATAGVGMASVLGMAGIAVALPATAHHSTSSSSSSTTAGSSATGTSGSSSSLSSGSTPSSSSGSPVATSGGT